MPAKADKPCRKCKVATNNSNGYCDDHQDCVVAWSRSVKKQTTTQRGYGAGWRRIRGRVLKRDKGLCQPCKSKGIYSVANEVDHIVNKASGGDDSMSNLQVICKDCHKAKTQKESVQGRGGIFSRGDHFQ